MAFYLHVFFFKKMENSIIFSVEFIDNKFQKFAVDRYQQKLRLILKKELKVCINALFYPIMSKHRGCQQLNK